MSKLFPLFVVCFVVFGCCQIKCVLSKSYRNINVINRVNRHTNQIFPFQQFNDAISKSLELSSNECGKQFQWDRWNCPSTDFLTKRSTSAFDRESAYVQAINVAALVYTISRNCSILNTDYGSCGCNFGNNSNIWLNCADRISYVEKIITDLHGHSRNDKDVNIQEFVTNHNSQVGRLVVRRSLKRTCRCSDLLENCDTKMCFFRMSTFTEIAQDIRRIYDRSVLLSVDNNGNFDRNIKPNTLVYISDSPNYCSLGAISGWTGMRGRQCSRNKTYSANRYEKRSCKTLCRACGLRIRRKLVMKKYQCNCKFNWCCNVTCEECEEFDYEYFCE